MELKPGYKQTEVGVIPEDWEIAKLCTIADLATGNTPPTQDKTNYGDEFLFVSPADLNNSKWILNTEKKLSKKGFSLARCFPRESILFTCIGSTIGKTGMAACELTSNQQINAVFPNAKYSSEFLYYLLDLISPKIKILAGQQAVPIINKKEFGETLLPWPPNKSEQTAIANALSDTDALIQSLTRLIAKKRQIKQGAMQTLLNPYENRRLKAGWVVKSILELADNKKELFDDGDWIESEHITNNGIRLIQTGNIGVGQYIEKEAKKYIYEASFEKLHCKPLRKGDLLICRLAEPAGRACVLPDIGETKIVTSVDVTIFRPRKDVANRIYLANLFSTPGWFKKVNESVGGTTHKRISRGSLGKIEIAIPNIDEQNATAIVFSGMDTEIAALETKLAKYRNIKQGMMQNLLTGRIRLVKPESSTGAAA